MEEEEEDDFEEDHNFSDGENDENEKIKEANNSFSIQFDLGRPS